MWGRHVGMWLGNCVGTHGAHNGAEGTVEGSPLLCTGWRIRGKKPHASLCHWKHEPLARSDGGTHSMREATFHLLGPPISQARHAFF